MPSGLDGDVLVRGRGAGQGRDGDMAGAVEEQDRQPGDSTARTTRPRSSTTSGRNARSATGMAPTAYRTSGAGGISRLRSMAATKARVPRRNSTDAVVSAMPSEPARSA